MKIILFTEILHTKGHFLGIFNWNFGSLFGKKYYLALGTGPNNGPKSNGKKPWASSFDFESGFDIQPHSELLCDYGVDKGEKR